MTAGKQPARCWACQMNATGDRRRANRAVYLGFYVTGEMSLWCDLHAEQAEATGAVAWLLSDLPPMAKWNRMTVDNAIIRMARPRPATLETVKQELRREIVHDVLGMLGRIVIDVQVDEEETARPSGRLRSVGGDAS